MRRQWFRLDNAALIFPAIMKRGWNNVFRVSATLKESVDPDILRKAALDIKPRFPSFFVRLKTGFFWYYLDAIKTDVPIVQEYAYPLTHMSRKELRKCCIRIVYYNDRIAVEFFHSVTDGTGGLIFLKNLVARYLEIKHGISVPHEDDIFDIEAEPSDWEVRDCFQKCTGRYPMSRTEQTAFKLSGTPEPDNFRHLITGILPTDVLIKTAHSYGVTVTAFLSGVMAESVCRLQQATTSQRFYKPVKITLPVNLRRLFKVNTLRNFVLTLNIGIDPKTGDYSLEEICSQISHQLSSEAIPQKMAARIAANVLPQRNLLLRMMPLPVKSIAMRSVYFASGEKKGCINVSNLGNANVPPAMAPYIDRFEFIIGVQYTYPNNCSLVSYGNKTVINMIRSTKESEIERLFFSRLVELGVPVSIESNTRR